MLLDLFIPVLLQPIIINRFDTKLECGNNAEVKYNIEIKTHKTNKLIAHITYSCLVQGISQIRKFRT